MRYPVAFVTLLALFCPGFPSPAARAAEPPPPPRRPNVLLIVTDDQGYGDLGCTGNPHVRTPHIDRLAAGGVTFDRFLVSPLCAPTRAALLTGRYSLRTGVTGVSRGEETMRPEEVTIAEVLKGAGYRTGIFGKWHLGEYYPATPRGQGFDESFGFNCGHWNNYFDTTLHRNGRPEQTQGYITDVLTDEAIRFIAGRGRGDAPFFCHVAYCTPHSPFQVPDRYFNRYKAMGLDDRLACVYGMCENVDENVGRLLAKLDELKLRDDTIVIFMSDNGPNGQRFNAGMRGAKGSPYEGGSRVPFFLSWPARFKEPRVVKQVAAHVDLFPTLVALCGVRQPKTPPQDGRSLVPLMEGREEGWVDRALIFQHVPVYGRVAVRTQRYRLVSDGKRWALFDMQADPGETRDVIRNQAHVAASLMAEYGNWWQAVEPDVRHKPPPIPVGHAEEDPIDLLAPRATLSGGLRFSGRHPNNAWLVGWSKAEAAATWQLDVVRGGVYEVSLGYTCPKADAGAAVRVTAGDASATGKVTGTPIRKLPAPDRVPRDEVYEMEWSTLNLGTLELKGGPMSLTVTATAIPGAEAMQLKYVRLRRATDRAAR